jgi:hypothetical protein
VLLPLARVGKRFPVLILAFLAASCGGSAKHAQSAALATVHGPGFHFQAPAAWTATQSGTTAVARRDAAGDTFVSSTAFTLSKRYRPALFDRAAKELDKVAANLASQGHGTLTHSETVTVDGSRIRVYRLTVRPAAGKTYDERIGFVLVGKREFQLLCRAPAGAGDPDGACSLLYSTFTTA